jgi:hypothetical protein
MKGTEAPTAEKMEQLAEIIRAVGLEVTTDY